MKYYVVLDTNVIISSMLKRNSIPGLIVDLATKGDIVPLLNHEILNEYEEVLSREQFEFDPADVREFLQRIKDVSIIADRLSSNEQFTDEDDRVFYEVTLTGRLFSEVYLVTGNSKHFPSKPFVVSPRQMLEIVNRK